jgi:hypothetical protein
MNQQRKKAKPTLVAEAEEDAVLGEQIQTQIGAKLKALYDEAAQEPVPDRFRDLLKALATKEKGRDDRGNEVR